MKASNLHEFWASPDNTRLTPKQFSFRLPTHIAAKIAAACEMYPTKNRTQIVSDLLTFAMEEFEKNLPEALGPLTDNQSDYKYNAEREGIEYEPVYHLGGARGQFRELANKHFTDIEQELGIESPDPLYHEIHITKSELEERRKK
ncbi:hypothetical protein IAI53_01640 [Thauera sp. CAU 1555]|uniref:CopG family transcriptional regulator n=1 Tax=Thauera sedimentorum TaxID=2767595 RepID=A0ABR9B805_9RHOO|nr:hypothetical protein [Thauera sedimentorum]MBC9070658.1 hypothetical protein [Thauera sedimentorum]MBD8501577.1 hypothetical protein [Thauera sedimentorum]